MAGCHTSPGAAAVGGSRTISVDELAHQATLTARGGAPTGSDPAGFDRQVLTRLIDEQLVTQLARQRHISVSSAQLQSEEARLAAQFGGLRALQSTLAQHGIPRSQTNAYIQEVMVVDQLGNQLLAGRQMFVVHTAQILVAHRVEALRLLHQVTGHPSAFASLAARYSQDAATRSTGGDQGLQAPQNLSPALAQAANSHPAGSFFVVSGAQGWSVVHLISKGYVTYNQHNGAVAQAFATLRSTLITRYVANEARRLGVHVNPRFGYWSAAAGAVLPPRDAVSSPAP
jgi:hypothetical protein